MENNKRTVYEDEEYSTQSGIINKGPWTKEEDERLKKLVERYSPRNWSFLAKIMGSRQGKQCRERWHNHLNPDIKKTPFTKDEDKLIIQLHLKYGNRWSEIAKHLPGRTDNAIKNYWNSSILRRQQQLGRERSCSVPEYAPSSTNHFHPEVTSHSRYQSTREEDVDMKKIKVNRSSSVCENSIMNYVESPPETDYVELDEEDIKACEALVRFC
ncbi:myb-related protein A-like [Arctopsyche grandis]|uniref:myb-related protein A-like n=1 Tax=Arctopsyche grandis TaxID=121162 RepID=UPI00406D7E5C